MQVCRNIQTLSCSKPFFFSFYENREIYIYPPRPRPPSRGLKRCHGMCTVAPTTPWMNLIKTHRRAWSGWRSFYTTSQTALTYSGHEINDGTRCSIRGRFAVTKHSFICPGDELRLHERRGKSIRAAALAFITMNAYQSQNILAFFNKKITRTHSPAFPASLWRSLQSWLML